VERCRLLNHSFFINPSDRSIGVLDTLGPGGRSLVTTLREVACVVLGAPGTGPLAMARLPAFAPSFRSPLTIVGKVARAVLAADVACARGPFPILSEVSRVRGTTFFCHQLFLPPLFG
jgi:hypothetical protein